MQVNTEAASDSQIPLWHTYVPGVKEWKPEVLKGKEQRMLRCRAAMPEIDADRWS
jgi:hypothetical protein